MGTGTSKSVETNALQPASMSERLHVPPSGTSAPCLVSSDGDVEADGSKRGGAGDLRLGQLRIDACNSNLSPAVVLVEGMADEQALRQDLPQLPIPQPAARVQPPLAAALQMTLEDPRDAWELITAEALPPGHPLRTDSLEAEVRAFCRRTGRPPPAVPRFDDDLRRWTDRRVRRSALPPLRASLVPYLPPESPEWRRQDEIYRAALETWYGRPVSMEEFQQFCDDHEPLLPLLQEHAKAGVIRMVLSRETEAPSGSRPAAAAAVAPTLQSARDTATGVPASAEGVPGSPSEQEPAAAIPPRGKDQTSGAGSVQPTSDDEASGLSGASQREVEVWDSITGEEYPPQDARRTENLEREARAFYRWLGRETKFRFAQFDPALKPWANRAIRRTELPPLPPAGVAVYYAPTDPVKAGKNESYRRMLEKWYRTWVTFDDMAAFRKCYPIHFRLLVEHAKKAHMRRVMDRAADKPGGFVAEATLLADEVETGGAAATGVEPHRPQDSAINGLQRQRRVAPADSSASRAPMGEAGGSGGGVSPGSARVSQSVSYADALSGRRGQPGSLQQLPAGSHSVSVGVADPRAGPVAAGATRAERNHSQLERAVQELAARHALERAEMEAALARERYNQVFKGWSEFQL